VTRKLYTPHEYQRHIVDHILAHERCAVWAGMGMGKTSSTLTAVDILMLAGESHPVLAVAPKRVANSTWPSEVKKWQHLSDIDAAVIVGTERERLFALRQDVPLHTVNYEQVPWLVETLGERWPYRTVIADESTRLAGFRLRQGTERAKALGRIAHTKIKRFIELTGTPAPNGLAKLWGQMWFLDKGERLGRTYDAFKQRWFQQSFDGFGVTPLPFAQEQIQDKLRDLCVTIDAKDWFDLNDPIVKPVFVDLPPKARVKYREMEREMFTQLECGSTAEAFNAAARTQKCLQLANGAVYIDEDTESRTRAWRVVHDEKLDALESIVEEAGGMPILVSYEFKSDVARIIKAFPKAVRLDTNEGMATFRAGKAPIGLAHPKSMGHGIDGLQDVTNIITFFGHNWDLELYQQIIERIGPVRQKQSGHERPVFIYHIIARDTVDELVMARRESKREVQDILLEAMKRRK
jgi:hypothetical protein